jgi:serine protein kinase
MATGDALLKQLSERPDILQYRLEHWQGTFAEYLDKVKADPQLTRTAYQRLYDMIMADGMTPVEGSRDLIRYHFFDSPHNGGEDAVFGLTRPLMELVNVFKSASMKYGTERRVLLLHGPVGSSKSTIARLLKRGVERYSRTPEGAVYSFGWKEDDAV